LEFIKNFVNGASLNLCRWG